MNGPEKNRHIADTMPVWQSGKSFNVKDQYIIEGQHRTRAMYLLGFKTVPGIGIEYD